MIRAEAHASTRPRPENAGASGLRAHRSPNRRRTCADASAAARVHTDELADTDIVGGGRSARGHADVPDERYLRDEHAEAHAGGGPALPAADWLRASGIRRVEGHPVEPASNRRKSASRARDQN